MEKKFSNTIKRDKKILNLQKLDYKIYYFWECKLKNTNKTLARVKKYLVMMATFKMNRIIITDKLVTKVINNKKLNIDAKDIYNFY